MYAMSCDTLYFIYSSKNRMQLVEIELDPTETVIGEAGAMMFMEDGIKFESKFGDGSEAKTGFFKSKKRKKSKE
jgi:uncharacterized protein (AIM24 family)